MAEYFPIVTTEEHVKKILSMYSSLADNSSAIADKFSEIVVREGIDLMGKLQ